MARPIKHNADYFPHNCDLRNDRRCKALRSKYNLEGYAVFLMLLEILTNANHFQISNNPMEIELIAGDIDIDAKKLNAILEYLSKLGLLVMEKEVISSPILEDLKKMLNELRGKDRKRKSGNPINNDIVFPSENPTKENEVFPSENGIIHTENTQSKVKGSKVNKRKENEIKEKGNIGFQPPIFLNSFLKKEIDEKNVQAINDEEHASKEKSSAKKEIITSECAEQCKTIFLKQSPYYAWEYKDSEQLLLILQKIVQTKQSVKTENDLIESFASLLQKLPEYWRTKKFTIPNLNYNYNEIVNEIMVNNQTSHGKKQISTKPSVLKPPEIKPEPTEAEKIKRRTDFIKTIVECYERFVKTGDYGSLPKWVMYQTLVDEKILKLTAKRLEQYRNQALEKRKAELRKPQNLHETRTFKGILGNLNQQMLQGNEKSRIEIDVKNLAVQGLFEELKKKQIDIKTLLKN